MSLKIKLIVGLGNPGQEYEQTRHNVGFWLLDELAWKWKVNFKDEKKFYGEVARATTPDGDVWLLKPMTFMNRSGQAVAALAQFYKIKPEEILVVHDELDIPCGRIKFKLGGGNGGHNGLKDIQARLGTPNFYRLRLGIDHPGDRNLVIGYVLNKPSAEHRQQIDDSIAKSLQGLPAVLNGEWEEATRFYTVSKRTRIKRATLYIMFRRPENRRRSLASDKPIEETVNMNELTSLMQTEPPGIVGETLDFCLYECSIEDAPDAEEVAQWRDILKGAGWEICPLGRYLPNMAG